MLEYNDSLTNLFCAQKSAKSSPLSFIFQALSSIPMTCSYPVMTAPIFAVSSHEYGDAFGVMFVD